jgi:peptide/nickel transport system ATP-binding protein
MSADRVLDVERLVIGPRSGRAVVDGISLTVDRGEVMALIGESGSGKTTLALSALGHVRAGLAPRSGSVRFAGAEMLGAGEGMLRGLRGRRISYVAQSAAASFNPSLRLNYQVIEPALMHGARSADDVLAAARRLYRRLDLPDPDHIGERYPHEVSGGQLQRFMIAMGLIDGPQFLVCDEVTSALDVTTQVEVLKALKSAIKEDGVAALFVSHDLAVVAQIADRITVLKSGHMVEQGSVAEILEAPKEAYTRQLIDACRRWDKRTTRRSASTSSDQPALLAATALKAGFGPRGADGLPKILAVNDISFTLARRRVTAVIGESGSGKSTLAQVIAGLIPAVTGETTLDGKKLAPVAANRDLEQRRRIQVVFQMADTALNPRHSVGRILGRALSFFWGKGFLGMPRAERIKRTIDLLDMVRLPAEYMTRRPGQLSGGEKQRVNLARALAAEPEVLICDEITSALDTVVAEQIVRLVEDLRDRLGLAILFISHDLATVATLADDVIVMRRGVAVEQGAASAVLSEPQHAYTRLLIDSAPELRTDWLDEAVHRRAAAIAEFGADLSAG